MASLISIVLLVRVQDDGIGVTQAGGWPAPLGISLVVDDLAAIMLVVSSIMLLTVFVENDVRMRDVDRIHSEYPVLPAQYAALLQVCDRSFVGFREVDPRGRVDYG